MSAGGGVKAGRAFVVFDVLDKTAKGMNAIAGRLDNMARRVGNLGRQLTIIGSAISVPFVMAINSAKDLTDELLALKAVLQADSAEMETLEKRIRGLGKSTSFTSIQVAEAATNLARGGFSSQEIRDSLKNVLDLARGGQLEMSRAATIMVDSIRNFGLTTADSESVASSFFVAATKGTITVEELAQAFKFSGGSMAELGLSLNEGLAVLSQISKAMLKGTIGGTSFNQMLLAVGKNADKLRDIGVEPFDASGQLKDSLTLFRDLAATLRAMPPAERLPVMADIFNVRGMRAAGAMTRLMKDIDEAFIAIENSAGRAAEASQIMDSGIGGSIRRIISAATDLKESVGIAFTETFQRVEKAIIPVLNRLSDWAAQNEELFIQAAKVAIGITAVGIALIGVSGILATFAGIVSGAAAVLSVLSGTAGTIGLVLVGFTAIVTAVGTTIFLVWDKIKKKTKDFVLFLSDEFKILKEIIITTFKEWIDLIEELDFLPLISTMINLLIPIWKFWIRNVFFLIEAVLFLNRAFARGLIVTIKTLKILFGALSRIVRETGETFNDLKIGIERITGIRSLNTLIVVFEKLTFGTSKWADSMEEANKQASSLNDELNKTLTIDEKWDKLREKRRARLIKEKKSGPKPIFGGGIADVDDGRFDVAGRRPRRKTEKEIKTERERREKISDLQKQRAEAITDRRFEDMHLVQTKKERISQRREDIKERKKDLATLAALRERFLREDDIKRRRQIEDRFKELSEQLRKQVATEKEAGERAAISEAERWERRRRETERILEIEKEIKALGGRLDPVPGVPIPKAKPGVGDTTKLTPFEKRKIRWLEKQRAKFAKGRKIAEERINIFKQQPRGPSVQGVEAGSISALQTAFGNREGQKTNIILKELKRILGIIAKLDAEAVEALRGMGIPVGE